MTEMLQSPETEEWSDPYGTFANKRWQQLGESAFLKKAEGHLLTPRALHASIVCIANLTHDARDRLLCALLTSPHPSRCEFIYRTYIRSDTFLAKDRARMLAALIEEKNPEWLGYIVMQNLRAHSRQIKQVVEALAATRNHYFISLALMHSTHISTTNRAVLARAIGYAIA